MAKVSISIKIMEIWNKFSVPLNFQRKTHKNHPSSTFHSIGIKSQNGECAKSNTVFEINIYYAKLLEMGRLIMWPFKKVVWIQNVNISNTDAFIDNKIGELSMESKSNQF